MQPLMLTRAHGGARPAYTTAGYQPRAPEDMAGTRPPAPEHHGTKPSREQPSCRPKAVSLFSGCGGSDTGLIAAGFDIILANDISAYARDLYQANLPETDFQFKDIRRIRSFPKADLVVGCYPCQGFSQGGARESERTINYLYREFDRALRQIKPKAFVVENVAGMRRSDFAHLLSNQIRRFRMAGYRVDHKVLDAADFGVPQHRRRIFIVGIRSDLGSRYTFPERTHGGSEGAPLRSVRQALTGLPDWPDGEFFDDEFHWYYMSRNRHCSWSEPSKTIVSRARHMPLHPISPPLVRIHTDKWTWASDGRRRRFSYREAACLQGFSSELIFPDTGHMKSKYRAIGNAVPPALFGAIGRGFDDIW